VVLGKRRARAVAAASVEYQYNRQGEVRQIKDQNQTIHDYVFDKLGRQLADKATTLGSGIDGTIRRIDRAYDVRGKLEKVTSYDDINGGPTHLVNQSVFKYNAFGLMTQDSQEHLGAVDNDTLAVSYGIATADHGLRLTSISYPKTDSDPTSRTVNFTYGATGSAADNLNRLDAIKDSNNDVLAQYSYLGLRTIVVEDYATAGVKLDYWGGTTGVFTGIDQFGRIKDQAWKNDNSGTAIEEYRYGYDRARNPIWKEHVTASGSLNLDEKYAFDEVYRLTGVERGNLVDDGNGGKIIESGTKDFAQSWGLDSLGNSATFKEDQGGNGWDLEQGRTTVSNEITDVTEGSGQTHWVTPVYDKAGNMTTMPSAVDPTVELTCVYDAWNRLVSVSGGGSSVSYVYNGSGWKIERIAGGAVEHYYYAGSQVVETRTGGTSTSEHPEDLDPHYQ
jgi:hypothetical protein